VSILLQVCLYLHSLRCSHLLLLPDRVLRVASLLQALGFCYDEMSEEVYTENYLADREVFRGWIIEQYPGVLVQQISSGHYWISSNEFIPIEYVKDILNAVVT